MECPACGAENAETHRFCAQCGARLARVCEDCGFENQPDGRFCGGCGAALGHEGAAQVAAPPPSTLPAGERRQVTVLFADLAGFTSLSQARDPEETHALLNRYFDTVDSIVADYGGSIDKHIGDSVMAVFGAPVAHGDDPARACRAALDIQRAVVDVTDGEGRPLRVHIGIASGEVVASGTGSEAHQEYTVTGDTVNLASRLQDLAQAGDTLLSDSVHRIVASHVACEAVDSVAIKGLDRPVQVWRLLHWRQEDTSSADAPFVGRQAELRQFAGVIESTCSSGRGQSLLLRGEAGIGKTRLLDKFAKIAREAGFACHAALVLDFGAGRGQDAIRALIRSFLDLGANADEAARVHAAERAEAEALLPRDSRLFLNELLDLPQPPTLQATFESMDNAARAEGQHAAVGALVRDLSARRQLFLRVEDIHWASADELRHLAALAAIAGDNRVVLAMSSRLEGDPLDQAWRAASESAPLMTIDLAPLCDDEAMALAAEFGGVAAEFARDCVERAEGNPLFLDQLLRMATDVAGDAIPATIQSLVLARADQLPPEDKRAIQAASVVGQRFSLDTLRFVLGSQSYDIARLVRDYLIRPAGEDWLFAHALIRDGVYASLLRTTRQGLHRQAANWYELRDAELCARHLDRAEDAGAAEAYLAAARAEADAYRHEKALVLANRGAELGASEHISFELKRLRGELLLESGDATAAIDAFETALAEAKDDAVRCHVWTGLARCMRLVDRYDDALDFLAKAQEAAAREGLTIERVEIHHLRGNIFFPLGRIDECLCEHQLALDLGREAGSAEAEARALGGLGDAYYQRGMIRTAFEHFDRCVELCRANGFQAIEVANLCMRANSRYYLLDFSGTLEDYERTIDLATTLGHHRAKMVALMGGDMLFETGEENRSEELLREGLAIAVRLGARRFEPWCQLMLAKILTRRGEKREAHVLAVAAVQTCRETGFTFSGPMALAVLGLVSDDPEERRRAFVEGESALEQGCVSHNYLHFYRDAIDACLAVGEWDEVERYATALEAYTQPEPLPWTNFFIARGRALAAFGRGEGDAETVGALRSLKHEAERVGLAAPLPEIEAALANVGAA